MEILLRKDAKALGLKRYFTGKPCQNGHICQRQVSSGACMICNLARVKANYDPDKKREYRKQWYEQNRERSLATSRAYHAANREKRSQDRKERRQRGHTRIWEREYTAKRRAADLQFVLVKTLRSRINSAIKRRTKTGSAIRDLGCSIDFLMQYLAAQFAPDMTWQNWRTVWQIDHIKPLASFDLADQSQFVEAVRYTNLRPLHIAVHRQKSARERVLYGRRTPDHQPICR